MNKETAALAIVFVCLCLYSLPAIPVGVAEFGLKFKNLENENGVRTIIDT